ncbi:MAG: hypothetical protein IJ203_08870, partial [Atopobiaceae bacterium]|nr:hypothetical protein [Atopobiaceae bacterium]
MATTRDYTDYLNDQVDIAPVNSQEEVQAAEIIERLFVQHGLETQVQEFDAPTMSGLSTRVYLIVLFVGMLLSGFLGTPVGVVGLILVAVAFVLLLLARNGNDLLASVGPQVRSQNVIGVHRATGPNVIKGARPIVIIAHYDTPRENFLNGPQLAKWQPLIKRLSWPLSIAVLAMALLQVIPIIPVPARHVFWVLGVLAALPLLLLGASSIYERFAACTTGANDNKASVAAMLGVLDMVRPGPDAAKEWAATHPKSVRRTLESDLGPEDDIYDDEGWEDELDGEEYGAQDDYEDLPAEEGGFEEQPYEDEYPADEGYDAQGDYEELSAEGYDESEDQYVPETIARPAQKRAPAVDEYGLESPATVRRGAAVLESLQVLPETCEIVYENLTPRDEMIERLEASGVEPFATEEEELGGVSAVGARVEGVLAGVRDGFMNLVTTIRDFFAGLISRFTSGEDELLEDEDSDSGHAEVEVVDALTYDEEYDAEDYEELDEYADTDSVEGAYDEQEPLEEEVYEGEEGDLAADEYYEDEEDYDDEYLDEEDLDVPVADFETIDDEEPENDVYYEDEPMGYDLEPMPGPEPVNYDPLPEPVTSDTEPEVVSRLDAEPEAQADPETPSFPEPTPFGFSVTTDAVETPYEAATIDVEEERASLPTWDVPEEVSILPEQPLPMAEVVEPEEQLEVSSFGEAPLPLDEDDDAANADPVADAQAAEDALWTPTDVAEEDVPTGELEQVAEVVDEQLPIEDASDVEEPPVAETIAEEVVEAAKEELPIDETEAFEEAADQADATYIYDAAPEVHDDEPAIEDAYVEPVAEEIAYEDDAWEPLGIVDEDADDDNGDNEPAQRWHFPEVDLPTAEFELVEDAYQEGVTVEVVDAAALGYDQDLPAVERYEPSFEAYESVAEEAVEPEEMADETVEQDEMVDESVDETAELASALEEPLPLAEEVDEEPVDEEPLADEIAGTEDDEVAEFEPEPETVVEPPVEDGSEEEAEPVELWTPQDDELDADEAEPTQQFEALSEDQIERARIETERANAEASSILHQMFATRPEQERYEAPKTTDILHQMFATLPEI